MTKPFCFETFIKTGKGSKDDSGSQGCTVKKRSNQLTWERKGLRCKTIETLTHDLCTTRSARHARTWMHFWHVLCTNIITTTNSNTRLHTCVWMYMCVCGRSEFSFPSSFARFVYFCFTPPTPIDEYRLTPKIKQFKNVFNGASTKQIAKITNEKRSLVSNSVNEHS